MLLEMLDDSVERNLVNEAMHVVEENDKVGFQQVKGARNPDPAEVLGSRREAEDVRIRQLFQRLVGAMRLAGTGRSQEQRAGACPQASDQLGHRFLLDEQIVKPLRARLDMCRVQMGRGLVKRDSLPKIAQSRVDPNQPCRKREKDCQRENEQGLALDKIPQDGQVLDRLVKQASVESEGGEG
ncbi:MAG: hypothetical protein N2689_12795 [Verrucomicrobiae bacterium]|nr:hypothetical protein [Verrucomicrobiae bacterium]